MDIKDMAMNIKEVAKFLGISKQMVYNMVGDGRLKAFKLGSATRIMYSDLIDFINEQKKEFVKENLSAANPDDSLFAVQNLNLLKGGFQLKDISFSFPRGKILAVLGISGSGKTLLLRSINGLENYQPGSVFLGKKKLDNIPLQKRNIGFVFQDYALYPNRNVEENIDFPQFIKGSPKTERKKSAADKIDELHIDESYLGSYPSKIPEGFKQMIAIARETNKVYDLLLLDEPMSHLDQKNHIEMRGFIKKILQSYNTTIIMSLNDPDDALILCDYTAVLDEGKLIQFGNTQDVYRHPANIRVMELTSKLEVNHIVVEIRDDKILPFGIPVKQPDGSYQFVFRADEIEIDNAGIQAFITKSSFYDSHKQLAQCKLQDGAAVTLVIPSGCEGKIGFKPVNPYFFNIPGDEA